MTIYLEFPKFYIRYKRIYYFKTEVKKEENPSILDIGVSRTYHKSALELTFYTQNDKFLLTNLPWNKNENFEALYPDLFFEKEKLEKKKD